MALVDKQKKKLLNQVVEKRNSKGFWLTWIITGLFALFFASKKSKAKR